MKKKVLFITIQDMGAQYSNGGIQCSQKNYHLIEDNFGHENVYLCTFSEEQQTNGRKGSIVFRRPKSRLGELISAICGCKIYFPWDEKAIIRFIKDYNADLIFIDSSTLGRLAKIKKISAKTIVFYHNIEADYAWNKVKNEGIHFLPSYWASKYNDKCGTLADKVICLNTRDSQRLYNLYGRKADFLLPITFADSFDIKKTTNTYKRQILFVGSFFSPNQLSVEWFIDEVMPKLNNVVLNIVGKDFEKMKEKYEKCKNVCVIGSVQQLDTYYYEHALTVLPIICGAGMKVKTAEAMMYGRTILASDEALEGYEVDGVEGIIRCNRAEEYVNAINDFFDKGIYKPYQEQVRRLFLEKYENNSIKEQFYNFISELLY